MFRKACSIAVAGVIGSFAFGAMTPTASAQMVPQTAVQIGSAGSVEYVQRGRGGASNWSRDRQRDVRRYEPRRHGQRYRSPRGRYTHRHDGWYYAVPWFLGLGLGAAIASQPPTYAVPQHGAHVQWCQQRYRSYNPNTDAFLGYDGNYHRCNSPYVAG